MCLLLVSNVVKKLRIFGFAAEPMVLATKSQSCSQLIGLKRFKNYHFAIMRHYCAHIVRFVKVADFQSIAGANRTNSFDWVLKGYLNKNRSPSPGA